MEDTGSAQYQYRKVMKPLLERKRRARINGCLDELKELMECLGGDQSGGQGRMQRLEKADVLEVTVNHLRNLKAEGRLVSGGPEAGPGPLRLAESSTYRSGYSACAAEVAGFICHPYSGVAQPQAARIARVVAEGLTKLQTPASARLATSPDTAEAASPVSTPRPSSSFSFPGHSVKEENSEEEANMDSGSAPLDLSKRL